MNKLINKLKEPGVIYTILFILVNVIGMWCALVRPWEGLQFGL